MTFKRIDARAQSKAHAEVHKALRNGKLRDGCYDKCADCGYDGSLWYNRYLVAHHEDYSKPLEVIWLCQGCNMKRAGKSTRTKYVW